MSLSKFLFRNHGCSNSLYIFCVSENCVKIRIKMRSLILAILGMFVEHFLYSSTRINQSLSRIMNTKTDTNSTFLIHKVIFNQDQENGNKQAIIWRSPSNLSYVLSALCLLKLCVDLRFINPRNTNQKILPSLPQPSMHPQVFSQQGFLLLWRLC